MKNSIWVWVVWGAQLVLAPSAFATFSGSNGQVVFGNWSYDTPGTLIYGLGGSPLTPATPNATYTSIQFSPDGRRIAYIEQIAGALYPYRVQVMQADGSNAYTLLSSDGSTDANGSSLKGTQFLGVTWLHDGETLAVTVETPGNWFAGGIYTVSSDGSGLAQIFPNTDPQEQTVFELEGSPVDQSILFRCRYRIVNSRYRDDYCVLNSSGGYIRIPVDIANLTAIWAPHWSPDGTKVLFAATFGASTPTSYTTPAGTQQANSIQGEIFTINADGSGSLTQLTNSPPVAWHGLAPGSDQGAFGIYGVNGRIQYTDAIFSPDGTSILGYGVQVYPNGDLTFGFWSMAADASGQVLVDAVPANADFPVRPTWQALPQSITVNFDDDSGHPLKGMKVILATADGTTIDGSPINAVGGSYAFKTPIGPGEYRIFATLTDNCQPSATCTPAYDILYAPSAPSAVTAVFKLIVTANTNTYSLSYTNAGDSFVNAQIDSSGYVHLSDMATIYYYTREYVDWIDAHLSPLSLPATAHFYTFAVTDPSDGKPELANDSHYDDGLNIIVMGTTDSGYATRGHVPNSQAPENGEWHEFTHHLWYWNVSPMPCTGDLSHAGYYNPDTCNSLHEGFAEFLPTLAGQDLLNTTNAFYAGGLANLATSVKAWDYGGMTGNPPYPRTKEDDAVAALFWDLLGNNASPSATQVFGQDGALHAITLANTADMTLGALWAQLVTYQPNTVSALYDTFGPQTPFYDLDGDGEPDVSTVDVPFLLHGFFPVDQHQEPAASGGSTDAFYYDVGYAQRANPAGSRDGVVGLTSHNVYDSSGTRTGMIVPRYAEPVDPNAGVGINVVDGGGAPLAGGTAHLVYHYPSGFVDSIDVVLSGAADQVRLALPPYFNYLLPAGASLPACNPATDVYADVTVSVTAGATSSTQAVTVTNCNYLTAVAVATAPPALGYTFIVPVAGSSSYTLAITTAGTGQGTVTGAGSYAAGQHAAVTETPAGGSTFTGWSGPNASECAGGAVTMTANKSCVATFNVLPVVPNVVGDSVAAASAAITAAGLSVGAQSIQASNTVAAGEVIDESPAAGATAAPNSAVSLVVSSGLLRGDLNGDGQVDRVDLAIIQAALNHPASGPNDPRDLNHDGVINVLDARILATLCTYAGCATH